MRRKDLNHQIDFVKSLPTKTITASASLGILARSFMDLAAAGLLSGGRGWSDFLERQQNKKKSIIML